MRVLFLADAVFEELPGGSRVVARELALGLAARGHEVTFLVARHAPDAAADEVHAGVRTVRYEGAGRGRMYVQAGAQACRTLWAAQPYDIVHTHFAYAAVGPLRAIPASVPHIRSFYGPWDEEGWVEDRSRVRAETRPGHRALKAVRSRVIRSLRHRIEAQNLKRSRFIVVLSRHSRSEVSAFGCPVSKIRLVPGGADIERFRPAADKAQIRRELGIAPDRRVLFTVRRLAPRMGLDNLIAAMPAVAAKFPNALLLIGGKGPEASKLTNLIASLNIGTHVKLLGFIPDELLAGYFQAADLFVLPTTALEGFGLVTVEALAAGVPVVGTPVGATPEILSELDRRLIATGTGPDSLADAICRFFDTTRPQELAPERLHQFVRDRFTWDKHVRGVEALYAEAVDH